MGNFFDNVTQVWVKLTGRKFDPKDYPWLDAPHGATDKIGDTYIDALESSGLTREEDIPDSGLLQSVNELQLNPTLNPVIKEFYEHTSRYDFKMTAKWNGLFKPFGWLLVVLFSKRLQQLNMPMSNKMAEKGITSHIIKLRKAGKTVWTIWYRKYTSNNQVIFSGIYGACLHPDFNHPLLRVIFPLPNGNAIVMLDHEVKKDGSLLFRSGGKRFGQTGFYFTLKNKKGQHYVRYVRSMHERLHVRARGDELTATHQFNFSRLRFITLHYQMSKKPTSMGN